MLKAALPPNGQARPWVDKNMNNKIQLISVVLSSLLLSSCGVLAPKTNARIRSWSHVKPIVSALDDYYEGEKEYPKSLTDITPKYRKKMPKTEREKIWHMRYLRTQPDFYQLDFFHVHYNASYTNGILKYANSNPFQ